MSPSLLLLAATLLPSEAPKLTKRAQAFVTALENEDFAAASKDFDKTMQEKMPADKLGEVWKGLVKKLGPLKKQGAATAGKIQTYDVVWVACEFKEATLYTRVVFDKEGRVTGLFFTSNGPPTEYKAPAYVKREAFKDSDVQVGAGEWTLPATLSLPIGDGPFPAVVLVHGSGPHDRDEAIGPNRPFRDLAWGLASEGIAVLRYEKRTKHYPEKMAKIKDTLTVKEEVLDDALAATALLRKTRGIDPKHVFVLGHSLGAMAAPRIGELDPAIAGVILMASPSRSMGDVLIEQVEYILSLDPSPSDEQKKAIAKIKAQAEKLKDPKLSPDTPKDDVPLGGSAVYWLSMRDLQPVETVKKIKQPLLILQGGRDYQVTVQDFEGWKKTLADRKGTTLKSYPKLNHLFAVGEGKAKPEEYDKEGHVAVEVVADIAAWVKEH